MILLIIIIGTIAAGAFLNVIAEPILYSYTVRRDKGNESK